MTDGGGRSKLQFVGVGLIMLALVVSFLNPAAAAFMWITGILCVLLSLVQFDRLEELSVGPASISAKMRETVAKVEFRAEQIKEAEARIAKIIATMVLNRGGEHYVGGLGEEAKATIAALLSSIERDTGDAELTPHVAELRRRVGLSMIWALAGDDQLTAATNLRSYLKETDFQLPEAEKLRELADKDGIDLNEVPGLLENYQLFVFEGQPLSQHVAASLYGWKTRARGR